MAPILRGLPGLCGGPQFLQLRDGSVFLGLDANRLARWDMRTKGGVVDAASSPVMSYTGGKDYARGTKFRCAGACEARPASVCGGRAARATAQSAPCRSQHQLALLGTLRALEPNCLHYRPPPAAHPWLSIASHCPLGGPCPRPPGSSCMAASGDGYVVVGADDGRVRLYSEKTLTQAKTSIPGMGLPITSVDVTFDGGWPAPAQWMKRWVGMRAPAGGWLGRSRGGLGGGGGGG
jgi:hypothetical protein